MFDRMAIYLRFREGYEVKTSVELCRILGVKSSTVSQWKTGLRQVPWERMKTLVNEKGINWDWLLEGAGPRSKAKRKSPGDKLDRQAITRRFVSKLPDVSRAALGEMLEVGPVTIHKIIMGKMFAPWEKLVLVVDRPDTSWEWLIEGCEEEGES